MMNRVLIVVAILLSGVGNETYAQQNNLSETFQVIKENFFNLYPDAQVKEWELEAGNIYEVEFLMDDHEYEAEFGSDGKWIATERKIRLNEVPDPVMNVLQSSDWRHWSIEEVEELSSVKYGLYYEIELERRHTRTTIYFLPDGTQMDETTWNHEIPYDLNKPDHVLELPSVLNEISGLTDMDNEIVACVQDELGIIFILDINNGTILEQHEFEVIGDFEGLSYANGIFYILRSDGRLTILPDYKHPNEQINIDIPFPTKNNEGLGFDQNNNRLLIAAKSKPMKDTEINRNDRLIYQYDIANSTLDPNPIFQLRISAIIVAAQRDDIAITNSCRTKEN